MSMLHVNFGGNHATVNVLQVLLRSSVMALPGPLVAGMQATRYVKLGRLSSANKQLTIR